MNSRSRIFRILLAVAIITAIGITAVEAGGLHTFNAYTAEGSKLVQTSDGKWHMGVTYKIPHNTLWFPLNHNQPCGSPCYRPFVGGVDYLVAANLPDHKNPQEWDYQSRVQIDANWDKLILLVPTTYVYVEAQVIGNWGWPYDIYLTVYWR